MAGPEQTAQARRERGVQAYARILDIPPDQVPAAMATRVGPVFAQEVFSSAGGAAWSPSTLAEREHDVAILSALICQGVTGQRLTNHLLLARRHGLDEQALTALMVLLANYAGYAHASTAMEAVHTMFTGDRQQ